MGRPSKTVALSAHIELASWPHGQRVCCLHKVPAAAVRSQSHFVWGVYVALILCAVPPPLTSRHLIRSTVSRFCLRLRQRVTLHGDKTGRDSGSLFLSFLFFAPRRRLGAARFFLPLHLFASALSPP